MAENEIVKKNSAPRLAPFPSCILLILVILSSVLAFALSMIATELWPPVEEEGKPCRLGGHMVSSTEAVVELSYGGLPGPGSPSCRTDLLNRLYEDAWPSALRVVLSNDTHSGNYTFRSFEDGALDLSSGNDMGRITYYDLADNKIINHEDRMWLEGLGPGSCYTFEIVWDPTDEVIAVATFSTS